MAKPKKLPSPSAPADAGAALASAQTPGVKWAVIAQIGLGVIIVWALAIGAIPYVGYWLVGGAGVLTAVLLGFGIWIWNFTRKQRRILDVLKGATDEEGRKAAIEKLAASGSKDAMASLARARLTLQDDPRAAVSILEAIDLRTEPDPIKDEVRSNLALLYLMMGRPKDARPLADELRLDRAGEPKAKAMYAAVMAEAFARTGKADEAKRLVETYRADDKDFVEVAPLLLRAQVYTFYATKNRGLMRSAMARLAEMDPNQLAPFMAKNAPPEMQEAVRETLSGAGYRTRAKQQIQRK